MRIQISTWSVLGLVFFALWPLEGQETRGQILGRVTDSSGAVIVGAEVRALNTATNVSTRGSTNETGDYVLPYLIPGPYTLSVAVAGFKSYVREGLEIQVDARLTLNVTLEVGQQAETVRVVAETPLLDTSTASMGQVVNSRNVLELPLKDGMVLMTLLLAPGVAYLSGGQGWTRPFDTGNPSSISVDGTRSGSNQFTMDGAPNMARNLPAYSPPPGMVDEVKIQSTIFDASYGFMTGASLNFSLKTGTNSVHGQMYEFNQNPVFQANQFFSNRSGLWKSNYRTNRWGTSASGPVYLPRLYDGRSKTFWMYGYEGVHGFMPTPYVIRSVPTPAEQRGDFAALLAIGSQYQIYDPYSIQPAPGGRFSRQPLPGNVVPANLINPIAKNAVNLWFAPNLPGTADGTNNNLAANNAKDHYFNHLVRIDQNMSEKERFFVRTNFTKMDRTETNSYQPAGDRFVRSNRGAALSNIYMFSPLFFVEARYSYTRYLEVYKTLVEGWDLASLGFSNQYINQIKQVIPVQSSGVGVRFDPVRLPEFNVSNYQTLGGMVSSGYFVDLHDFAANFSDIVRSHTLRFGAGLRVNRERNYNFSRSSGSFTFDTTWTRGPLDSSASAPMGQSLASFMYGLPGSGYFPIQDSYAERAKTWAFYLQDDWKLSGKLMFSFGLRYELEEPLTERYNRSVQGFDPAAVLPIGPQVLANYARNPIPEVPPSQFNVRGGLTFAGVNGLPQQLWNTYARAFMPRAGIAYSLNSKTVLRSGYGMFFEAEGVNNLHSNLTGFTRNTFLVPSLDNGQTYIVGLNNPFPNGFDAPLGARGGASTNLGQSVSFFNQNHQRPYMQRWQFAVQRQLPAHSLVEVSYVGNRGTHQRINKDLDALPNSYLSTSPVRDQATINYLSAAIPNPYYPLLPNTSLSGTNVARSQLLRPYPQFTSTSFGANQGFSWYHSLQWRLEKRLAQGYTMSASWSWSKLMEAITFLNAGDPLPSKVISDQDRRHHVAVSGIWELPFGSGKRWAGPATRFVRYAISGWQGQGIYTYQTGAALGFGNALLLPGQTMKDAELSGGQRNIDRWINTNAFNRNSGQQLGSNLINLSPRFSNVRADGQNEFDLSVIKNTSIKERVRLQFRAEFINAFNHPQFSAPNTTPTSSAFGTVTGEWSWARVIQFGLKLMF